MKIQIKKQAITEASIKMSTGRPEEEELLIQELDQPAIPFHKETTKDEKTPNEKEDPSMYFYVNTSLSDQPAGRGDIRKKDLCGHSILKFQGGTPEQFCRWRRAMHALFSKRECGNIEEHHAQQLKLYRGALDGLALDTFNDAYDRFKAEEDQRQEVDGDDPVDDPKHGAAVVLAQALNELALRTFADNEEAVETQ